MSPDCHADVLSGSARVGWLLPCCGPIAGTARFGVWWASRINVRVVLQSALSGARHATRSATTTRCSCVCCSNGSERVSLGGMPARSIAFELDELIDRYKRSARELWKLGGYRTGQTICLQPGRSSSGESRGRSCRTGGTPASHAAVAEGAAFYAAGCEPVRSSLRSASGGQRSSRSGNRPTGRASRSVTR
jgi:hypothetical protein